MVDGMEPYSVMVDGDYFIISHDQYFNIFLKP